MNPVSDFDVNLLGCKHYSNSETQRLVQNVILKLEKINMVLVKPTMVKQP